MGIRGLFAYLQDNMAFDVVDLIKDALENTEIEILVDFNAYAWDLFILVLKRMIREYDNEFLLFPGGEFDIFFDAFYDFQKILKNVGIKLVWIVDGSKGIDKDSSYYQKRETWMKGKQNDITYFNEILSCCRSKKLPEDINKLMPLSTFKVIISSLKKAGAEVIQLIQGESDEFIAYEFHRRKSYAILTNDTDFLVFRDCRVIFPRFMKIPYGNEDCNLPFFDYENPGNLFKSPESFKCPIVKQQHIMDLLQFQSLDQLVALSILKGNDSTSEFCQELQYSLKLTNYPKQNAYIVKVADYILEHSITMDNILKHEPIRKFTDYFPQLIKAINYCKDFYSLERMEENTGNVKVTYKSGAFDNPLTDYLAKKLSNLELSKEIYSKHFGVTSDSIYPEEPGPDCKPISTIMASIDSKVYPYILHEKLDKVIEWKCRSDQRPISVPVEHANIKTSEIHSNTNITDSSVNGVDLFENIWSHLESSGCLNYFKKFGLDCGFICYILRYFYKITNNINLNVSSNEFRALFISVFYNYSLWKGIKVNTKLKRESFLRLKICPSSKCLIMNTWFLVIFGTAKYFCGGAFNLTEEFPSIQNIFNGSVFYAFYETTMNESNGRTSHLDMDLQKCIVDLDLHIMEKNKEIYIDIINDSRS